MASARVDDLGEQKESITGTQLPSGSNETILVIEDEPDVRALAEALLRSLGYRVLPAKEGWDGLDILKKELKIDLLLSEVVLPGGMSGPDFAKKAKHHVGGLMVLFMSGHAEGLLRHQTPAPRGSRSVAQAAPKA